MREWYVLNQKEEKDMRAVSILCLIAVLSSWHTKAQEVDENDICGQRKANNWGEDLWGKAPYMDFIARFAATANMDYAKRMDIAMEYGFRPREVKNLENNARLGGTDSRGFKLTVVGTCEAR